MMRNRRTRVLPGLGVLLALAGAQPSSAEPATGTMQPYTARYQVSYRGLSGGEIQAQFSHGDAAGQWLYETRAFPNLFGRLAVSSQARERSTMQVSSTGIRPLMFDFDDGTDSKAKDVSLRFDWQAGHVTGRANGKPVEFPLTPGTHDTASVQAAMIQELLAGREPQGFRIVAGGKLRDYRYWPEGPQQVMTPFGQVKAEVWASQRTGSDRVTKTWHAPSLGYVPVQAIQYRKGNAEVQMKLVQLQR